MAMNERIERLTIEGSCLATGVPDASIASEDVDRTGLEASLASANSDLTSTQHERDDLARRLAALETEHAACAERAAQPAPQEPAPAVPAPIAEVPASPGDLPDKDVAVAKVAEIAARTRGEGPVVDDDLKKIHGVGPKIEGLLKGMDVTSFRQVANFTLDDIQYVTAALDAFPGRIERDDWMGSAADEHVKKYGEQA